MANRRMFSNRIANSAKFLQMPFESQLLYFHMIIRADDDGVVESYPLIKLLGTNPDSLKILIAKCFIIILNEDQVVLVKDWQEHNKIRADRKTDSIYKEIIPEEIRLLNPKPRSDVKDNSKRLGGQSTDGISKVRLGEVNNNIYDPIFLKFYKEYPKKTKKKGSHDVWKRHRLDSKLDVILDFIEKAKKTEKWKLGFVPDPTTFLRGELWEDDIKSYGKVSKEEYSGVPDAEATARMLNKYEK